MIGYGIDETTGFPQDYKFSTVKGSVIGTENFGIQCSQNAPVPVWRINYTPTEDVLNKSAQITTIAGGGEDRVHLRQQRRLRVPQRMIWIHGRGIRILHIPMITAVTTVIIATIRITAAVIIPITPVVGTTQTIPAVETTQTIPAVETTQTIPAVEMMLEVIIPQKIPVAIPAAVRIFQTENKKEIIN